MRPPRAFPLLPLLLVTSFSLLAAASGGWQSSQLGNIFDSDTPVRLEWQAEGDADALHWRVQDFWQKEVATGTSPVVDGKAVITPKLGTIGYYVVRAEPRKAGAALPEVFTSFAIVRPHVSTDPLKSPFGVMTHFAQGMNPEMLGAFKRIGIESIRDEHYWAQVEKTKGVYEFPEKSAAYMAACAKAGILPLVAMTFGNPLYDHKDGPSTASGFEGYGNYGQAILKEYGNQIHWLEIWNEYNGTWAPPSARKDLKSRYTTYTDMLKTAYEKIKEVRPDVQVLGGAAVLIPLPYFEGIFKLGGLKYMDGIVIHPYRIKPEGVDQEVAELRKLIRKYHDGKDLPIWVTETGRHTKDEYDWERGRKMFEKGRAEGARYLARQYTLLLKEGVAKIYWYLGSDHATFVSMGLLRHHEKEASGMGRYAVAPSYVAYANLIHHLDGARFIGREAEKEYTRAHVYHFKRADGQDLRVCWATQPSKIRVKASQPLTLSSLMGAETELSPENGEIVLDLGEDAVYLTGAVGEISEIDSGTRVIASSNDDYSKTQGGNNWFYGYLKNGAFTELEQVETMWGYNWGGITKNLVISPSNMHPDIIKGEAAPAVLRWKSPVAGKVTIRGHWENKGKGDGVKGTIVVDGREISSHQVGGGSPERVPIEIPVEVKTGSLVDFICNPNASVNYDATDREFTISQEN
jgi:hypothetical protein